MLFSPLNHFQPIQIFYFDFFGNTFSLDSISLTVLLTFLIINVWFFVSTSSKPYFLTKPQYIMEKFIDAVYPICSDKPLVHYRGLIPFFLTLFITLAVFNLITIIIPLFYPISIQFFITFYLAGIVLGGVFLLFVYRYRGLVWYAFAVNSNNEIISAFLFFNEIFSFIMRLFSLSGRLALNMFAGHMLLFLITNVAFHLYNQAGFSAFLIFTPVLIFIHVLELLAAVLQAYVFTYLSLYYFREAIG